ncbi:head GIN domain-containing protein [Ferruginibacter sp.]
MKKLALLLVISVAFLSCHYRTVTGSGNIITEKRTAGSFSGLTASNDINVEVKGGAETLVEVQADDNIMQYVETHVSGGTLHVGLKENVNLSNASIKVTVTVPGLKRLEANSSASIKLTDVLKNDGMIKMDASSSGDIEGEVDAPSVSVDVNSGSRVKLSGKTRDLKVDASSGSSADVHDLLCESADVDASSGASASVQASVSLKADASSGGTIRYTGQASVKSNTNSGGSVERKD